MADYSYINARIRGMKGRLFKASEYEELFAMQDLSSVIHFLSDSAYGRFIVSAEKAGISEAEEALRRDLSDILKKIYDISDGDIKRLLEILLGRWDVYNIKTILRGRHINRPPEDIMPLLISTGALPEPLLKELCQQEDIKGIADTLITWRSPYGYSIYEGIKEYKESSDISLIELRLDRFYYTESLKKLKKRRRADYYVYSMLSFQIDMLNIITSLRILKEKRLKIYADEYFIEGGDVFSKELYQKVISEGEIDAGHEPERFMAGLILLNTIKFRQKFKIIKDVFFEIKDLPEMERMLEMAILKKAISLSLEDPLNISLIIGYIWRKINELINLRLILRGKLVEMPEQRLREMVVI